VSGREVNDAEVTSWGETVPESTVDWVIISEIFSAQIAFSFSVEKVMITPLLGPSGEYSFRVQWSISDEKRVEVSTK